MRRDSQQNLSLPDRLVNQMELAVLEVANTAVNQPRRPPGGATGKIVALNERHPEPAHSSIPGCPTTGDAAADYQHVEFLGGEVAHPLNFRWKPRSANGESSSHTREFDRKIRIAGFRGAVHTEDDHHPQPRATVTE